MDAVANKLVPFKFDNATIRAVTIEGGEPLFIAKDVAKILIYANPADAISRHCKAARTASSLGVAISYQENQALTSGLHSDTVLIPERDVYRLIMRSKLPAAERFEEWVVGEVLPAIRKTGSYSIKSPVELYQEALELMENDKQRASLSGKNLNEWKTQRRDHAANVKQLYADVQMLLGFEF